MTVFGVEHTEAHSPRQAPHETSSPSHYADTSSLSKFAEKLGLGSMHRRASNKTTASMENVAANPSNHEGSKSPRRTSFGGSTTGVKDANHVSYVLPPMLSDFDDQDDEESIDLSMSAGAMDSVYLG